MSALERASEAARAKPARIVFPEMSDDRVAQAAARLAKEGLAEPVELAPVSDGQMRVLIEGRGVREALARRMLGKPLIRAAAMVAAGEADILLAGADSPTRRVIEAAGLAIGLAPGVSVPSSFFLMVFPDGREMIWADCAVNTAPDAQALAAIAVASSRSRAALLGNGATALLSYSTGTSGAGESVDTVARAVEFAREAGCETVGPVQADAALNPVVAAKKGISVQGVNTLVFPSLDTGNIAYKLAQELAGAQAIGPMLQGFAAPVCDLSRGATVDDIVASSIIASALRG